MNAPPRPPCLILGLGASGLAMARWCARHGAQVTVADTREAPPQLATLRADCPRRASSAGALGRAGRRHAGARGVPLAGPGAGTSRRWSTRRGPWACRWAASWTCSRGRWRTCDCGATRSCRPKGAPSLVQARRRRASGADDAQAVASARSRAGRRSMATTTPSRRRSRSFRRRRRQGYAPAVLAITGTNGKTTVTALTGQLVERAGKTVAVAGNIGPTLLDTLSGAHRRRTRCPRSGCSNSPASSSTACRASSPPPPTVLNLTPGPPRLARRHGGLCRGQGARLRRQGPDGAQPRRRRR